jgi:hypothetical protein
MMILGGLALVTGVLMLVFIGRKPINAGPILGGILCGIIGYVLMRVQTGSEIWNSGRIVPAMVTREGEMAGMDDDALGIAGRAVGVGRLASTVGGSARPTTLQYIHGGQVKHAHTGTMYGTGNIVWIVLYQGAHTLPDCAPAPYDVDVSPPPEAQAWLKDALENTREQSPASAPPASNMAEQPPW